MVKTASELDLVRLERLNDPARFAEIELLHQRAFLWQPQGRIPLGIHVVDPAHAVRLTSSKYSDVWLDPEVFLPIQTEYLIDSLTVGSDLLPVVPINHFGNGVVTSMYGALQVMSERTTATLQDLGPTPRHVFSSIEKVADLPLPSIDKGLMPDVERFGRRYRESLPDWVPLVGPMPDGPFSLALELRGSDFLIDLVDTPDLCPGFIRRCGEMLIRIEQRFREVVGMSEEKMYSNFGTAGTGLRLGEDSICNLSPGMVQKFCAPAYRRVNEMFGGSGHLHFCSMADSRYNHLYPALAAMPEVTVVSSQFGFEYYQDHLDELRGRLAFESFYGDAYHYVCEKFGSFRAWANEFVPRYKDESGLELYMQVSSVEEGKNLWATWREAHHRSC